MEGVIRQIVLDTTVIVNFLVLGRGDLFMMMPETKFWVSEHVRREIAEFENVTLSLQLESLFEAGILELVERYSLFELALFGELRDSKTMGAGECAAMTLGIHRGWILATDDKLAGREFLRRVPDDNRLASTALLMLDLIRAGSLSVADADGIKERLTREFRFRMMFDSFRDLV